MSQRSRLRLVVLQVLVLSLMLTLFGRLYYLQVIAGQQYQQIVTSNSAQQARTLTVLSPAVGAESDRNTYIQRYVLIGVVGGLALGTLFSLLLGLRRRERNLSQVS